MIAAILALIPGFLNIFQSYYKAKADVEVAKVEARKAVGSAAVEAAAKEADGRAKTWGVISANRVLTILVLTFAAPIVIFEWKVVVWDTVFELGSTAPIKGQVGDWMNTIIASLFGASVVKAVAELWWTTKD